MVSTQQLAAAPKLPRGIFSVDDLIKEFRGPLQTKIAELSKNYIVHKEGARASFKSHEDINCMWQNAQAGEVLAKLELNIKKTETSLNEAAYYTGCKGQLNLKEQVVTTGTDLKPISTKEFFNGERSFDLKKNEKTKLYRLLAWDDEELFKLTLRRTPRGKVAEFYIRNQRFMNATYTFTEDESSVVYTFYGYNIDYLRKHSKWRMNRNRNTYALKAFAYNRAVSPTLFLNSTNESISSATFQRYFSFSVLQGTVSTIADFVKWHNFLFPTTEFRSTGAQNSRFLDELRMTYTRLLNNIEINLVRNLIQEYILALETGLLKVIDSRPKE